MLAGPVLVESSQFIVHSIEEDKGNILVSVEFRLDEFRRKNFAAK